MSKLQSKTYDFFVRHTKRTYKKHETLIQIDEKPPAYFIAEGVVAQCDISDIGDKLIVNLYKPGSFLPLPSLMNDIPTEFFYEALETTVVYVAPRTELLEFLHNHPDIAIDALARVSRGTNGLLKRMARTMGSDAEGRIIGELEVLHARFASDGRDLEITEAELAAQTGLARETVSRVLKRLKQREIVDTSRGRIRLQNFN